MHEAREEKMLSGNSGRMVLILAELLPQQTAFRELELPFGRDSKSYKLADHLGVKDGVENLEDVTARQISSFGSRKFAD